MSETFKNVLFKPSVVKGFFEAEKSTEKVSLGDASKEQSPGVLDPSGTFRYDSPGYPLKSSQQLNVDFTNFANHTFFNSAESKLQVAFEKIINQYPFDGTKKELIHYIDGLKGFQKYVLGEFPKNVGSLIFSGTQKNEDPARGFSAELGTFLKVIDNSGTAFAASGHGGLGHSNLDFSLKPFTIQFHIYVPSGSQNDNQVVLQKLGETGHGYTLALSSSHELGSPQGRVALKTILSSGSNVVSSSVTLQKGKFHQVTSVYDRSISEKINTYVDGLFVTSSEQITLGLLDCQFSPLTIGSGSTHPIPWENFVPQTTLSGALDELRMFDTKRSIQQIRDYKDREIFSEGKLKLYFKFNEPSGSFGFNNSSVNKSLVLDYSGKGYHTRVTNFSMQLRETGSLPVALSEERIDLAPVLFPAFKGVSDLNTRLLSIAVNYDYNNPNLITKMIPKHYLLEASEDEGYDTEFGNLTENYGYTEDAPGGGKMKSSQIIASLLFIWAEIFDDIKMFIDEFGRFLHIDYSSPETISDQMLPHLAKYYGFNLPNLYALAPLYQYIDGQDIRLNKTASPQGLQSIQNTLWRRVLSDLPEIVQSKGTRHSIEVIFRNMGIRPNSVFRIREYGGSKTRKISDSHEQRLEIAAMLDFTGSFSTQGTIGGSGKGSNRPLIQTHYLSSSRVSPGIPLPAGQLSSIGSTVAADGLMTSGSWTAECVFRLPKRNNMSVKHPLTQSLIRLQTTGSRFDGSSNNWVLFNVIARSPITQFNKTGSIRLIGRPVSGTSAESFSLLLNGVNVYDGDKWNVSFGRHRNDMTGSHVSSSYFLRVGKMIGGRLSQFNTVTGTYNDFGNNPLNSLSGSVNASGSFIVVGSQSLLYDSTLTEGGFINSLSSLEANYVNFTGKISGLKFYSKALTIKETKTHIRNFKSVGVENPEINYSFTNKTTGSFQRLRLNISCDQPVTRSNADGTIKMFDFSQNNLHASGTGFGQNKQAIDPERFDYLILSPRFETGEEPNKVRIRSYSQTHNIRTFGARQAPLYEIPSNEEGKDDQRVSVEVSSVQALNEDMVNIFATLDALDNAIGNPELLFSEEYRDLRNLRKVYFNRLSEKVSMTKFFEFFKWFDTAVGDIIEEVIPSNVHYLGTNFVVESHMLERAKMSYRFSDMYVGVNDRRTSSVLFLQQFLGVLRKR